MLDKLNSRILFLIDAIGALVSAVFLRIVLVRFENHFGMPVNVLNILAALATVFALYSFACYFIRPVNWKLYLRLIAMINLLYCLLTFGLVIQFFYALTPLGIAYFILELLIIILLVTFEFKHSTRT